jgi:Mn-containing catalase
MDLPTLIAHLEVIGKTLDELKQKADATRHAHDQATAAVQKTIEAQAQTFLDELARNKARSIRH